MSAVRQAHTEPGPNVNGWGVSHEQKKKRESRVDVETFLTGEIAELEAPTQTPLAVLPCRGEEQAQLLFLSKRKINIVPHSLDAFPLSTGSWTN